MNVFIKGGSGFLGKRLVSRLIKEQYAEKELLNLPSFITHPLANSIEISLEIIKEKYKPIFTREMELQQLKNNSEV